ISRRLSRFARQTVPHIVKKYGGELVYAGGDDVLAFVPIKNVLSLARELRQAFSDSKRGLDEKATASMGIVIAYCKDPLYRMLNRVRSLEKKAKSFWRGKNGPSKDAFALAYLARSGEQREVVLPWLVDPQNPDEWTVSHLNNLIDSIKSEVSSTFLFTFSQSFLPLLPREADREEGKLAVFGKGDPRNEELLEVELKRLLRRALKESAQETKAESLAKSLVKLHRVVPTSFRFIQLLEILRILGVKEREGASAKTG
ncbi:MAG: type III-B CRISPR-associated protein Cas10/Cmr2, partial [Bacillota bacterium]